MEIKNITETSCPDCGCSEVVSETVDHRHCTGHFNEYREFDCVMKLHFFPNFMKVQENRPCLRSVEFTEKKKKRYAAIDKMNAYIKKMKVDDEFKNMISDKFSYINYNI